jgi:hypothetical protein
MPREFTFATACSGTDLVVPVLRQLETWWAPLGCRTRFVHKFSCDSKPAARSWILNNWDPEFFFDDLSYLGDETAWDSKACKMRTQT